MSEYNSNHINTSQATSINASIEFDDLYHFTIKTESSHINDAILRQLKEQYMCKLFINNVTHPDYQTLVKTTINWLFDTNTIYSIDDLLYILRTYLENITQNTPIDTILALTDNKYIQLFYENILTYLNK